MTVKTKGIFNLIGLLQRTFRDWRFMRFKMQMPKSDYQPETIKACYCRDLKTMLRFIDSEITFIRYVAMPAAKDEVPNYQFQFNCIRYLLEYLKDKLVLENENQDCEKHMML